MSQRQEYLSHTPPPSTVRAWRALPRLIVSRRWRWVSLGVLVLAAFMIGLGVWQLDRLQQRLDRNAQVAQRALAAPLAIGTQPVNLAQDEYRRAVVWGTLDNQHSILLRNRALNGVPGMHLLTPLRIDGSDQVVLIDRGWLPLAQLEPEQRSQFDIPEVVEVQGFLRAGQPATDRIGPQDRIPPSGRLDAWFRVDTERITQQLPYPLLPYYVEAEEPLQQNASLPRPDLQLDLGDGPHLGYAIQWFAFTLILLGGYAAFVVTRSGPSTTH